MKFTAKEIAHILNGSIEGNPDVYVNTVSKIEEAKEGSLSFLANPKYYNYVYSTRASIVIVSKDLQLEKPVKPTLIRVEDAYSGLAKILEEYNKIKLGKTGISNQACLSGTTKIGKDVYIGDFVSIGEQVHIGDNVKIYPGTIIADHSVIGDNTIIFAGVKIYDQTCIGKNCTIHAGVVLGSDGFGFAPQNDKNYKKIAQIGNVVIEDNVEIGANTTIDRATMGSTIICKGVKLDNLIQIAHNVEIGENTVIASQAGVSGSTKIGKNCMIGGQVGITGHLKIADEVKIGAQSGISSSILKKGSIVLGSPAFKINEYRKSYVHFRNLDKIVKQIDEIKKELEANKW